MGDWAFPASGTGWQEDPWQELGDASPLALTDQRVHVTPLPFNMLPGMADAARALGLPPAPLLPAVPLGLPARGRGQGRGRRGPKKNTLVVPPEPGKFLLKRKFVDSDTAKIMEILASDKFKEHKIKHRGMKHDKLHNVVYRLINEEDPTFQIDYLNKDIAKNIDDGGGLVIVRKV